MAADWHGWFPTSVCLAFLGVGRSYWDKEIKSRVSADCVRRKGSGSHAPLWYLGRAVYEAAASRKTAVASRAVDQEVSGGEPMLAGGDSPALERFRLARAQIAELDLQERQGSLMPRDKVHDGLGRLATIMRGAGETIQRQYGGEGQAILNEALADFDREMVDTFGE